MKTPTTTFGSPALLSLFACGLLTLSPGCILEDEPFEDDTTSNETSGDGDGDMTTTGDGDGDMTTTGDGDGDMTTTGDGDGDPAAGDGDGEPETPICEGSEEFCDEAESYCSDGTQLEICQYNPDLDCVEHFSVSCPEEVGAGSMCLEISETEAGCTEAEDPEPEAEAFIIPNTCAGDFTELLGDAHCYYDEDVPVGVSLANAEMNSEGGLFFATEVPLGNNFETHFNFQILNPGGINDGCGDGINGADGFAFVIHEETLGGLGGGIGYEGVAEVVAIEFDTFCNPENNDPSSNHIGIMLDGVVNHEGQPTADVPGNWEDGTDWWGWIDYDGTTISVYVANEDVKPDQPNLTGEVDIVAVTGSGIRRIGFTSATGAAWENAIIRSWEFGGQGLP